MSHALGTGGTEGGGRLGCGWLGGRCKVLTLVLKFIELVEDSRFGSSNGSYGLIGILQVASQVIHLSFGQLEKGGRVDVMLHIHVVYIPRLNRFGFRAWVFHGRKGQRVKHLTGLNVGEVTEIRNTGW